MAQHASTFLLVTILALITVLLVFAMKYFSAGRQARLRLDGENAYRALSEAAVAAQSAGAASLAALQADLAETKARLAAIETMLREVA